MPHAFRPTSRHLAAAAVALMWSATLAPDATAHDAVVGGVPADGEVVSEFPDQLELTFSDQVQDGFNTFALSNSDTGEVVYSGQPTVEGRNVTLDLPADLEATPGSYRIGFQIISSDGHSTKGMTSFTYEPAARAEQASETPGESEAAGETSTSEAAESNNTWTLLAAALGVLVVGGAAIALIGKQRRRTETDATES